MSTSQIVCKSRVDLCQKMVTLINENENENVPDFYHYDYYYHNHHLLLLPPLLLLQFYLSLLLYLSFCLLSLILFSFDIFVFPFEIL